MNKKFKNPLGHTIWFKIILTLLVFIPPFSQITYDPANTPDVIAAVMAKPLITSVEWVMPLAKILLFVVIVLSVINKKFAHRILLGYYGLSLLIIGILQNISITEEFGYVWLTGNTLVQLMVFVFCLMDVLRNKTIIAKEHFVKSRIWMVFPMLLAFLMPYSVDMSGIAHPSFTLSIFLNESGVTYCMITPVIIGTLLLFFKGVYKPTLSIVSYVGFIFGLLNMTTWFGLQTDNWWMGVLHLPLVILSFYGLFTANREKFLIIGN